MVTPSAANPVWADDKIIVPTVKLAAVDPPPPHPHPPPPTPIPHHCLHPEFCVSLWPYHSIHTPSRHFGVQYLNGPDWIRTPSLAYVTTRHAVPEWTWLDQDTFTCLRHDTACSTWMDLTGSGHLHLPTSRHGMQYLNGHLDHDISLCLSHDTHAITDIQRTTLDQDTFTCGCQDVSPAMSHHVTSR